MLTRLFSPAFKCESEIRPVIQFHDGLNTVRGAFDARNSIGKSTFLNVIDFVFGGSTLGKSKPIRDNVGKHDIFFTFRFEGEDFHFSRNTGRDQFICIYSDKNWENKIEEWKKEDFDAFLKEKYGLDKCEGSWRQIMTRFFRIQSRASKAAENPLKAGNEPQPTGIAILQQLFEVYNQIKKLNEDAEKAEADIKALERVNALELDSIRMFKSKKERENANKELYQLQAKKQSLLSNEDEKQIQLQLEIANRKQELKSELSFLRGQVNLAQSKIRRLELLATQSSGINPQEVEDFARYFPNADLESLESIEAFHRKLFTLVNQEIAGQVEELQKEQQELNAAIIPLRTELTTVYKGVEMDETVLKMLSELDFQINLLQQRIEKWDTHARLKEGKKEAFKQVEAKRKELNLYLQRRINSKLLELCDQVSNGEIEPPRLEFSETAKSFEFYTPDDDGTGTSNKGVVLLDLALLNMTNLPVVAHDSPMFQSIDFPTTGALLELYQKQKKQIFIAFDRHESYTGTPKVKEIIEATTVIEVGPEEKALYGKAWNKKKNKKEQAE